uniref:Uncharacterized protein n=1 Tax=Hypotaenidia okinawae TaxID=2861861 RepID=A0A6G1RGB6_9GRUI
MGTHGCCGAGLGHLSRAVGWGQARMGQGEAPTGAVGQHWDPPVRLWGRDGHPQGLQGEEGHPGALWGEDDEGCGAGTGTHRVLWGRNWHPLGTPGAGGGPRWGRTGAPHVSVSVHHPPKAGAPPPRRGAQRPSRPSELARRCGAVSVGLSGPGGSVCLSVGRRGRKGLRLPRTGEPPARPALRLKGQGGSASSRRKSRSGSE